MNRVAAAFTLFTRIPAWKLRKTESCDYESAPVFWPLSGWATGIWCGLWLYLLSWVFPMTVAVIFALAMRSWLTSGLHEDGLADFFDGFGGGRNPHQILAIMKDSHVGTYGVLGLLFYYFSVISILSGLSPLVASLSIIASDPFSKTCASQITDILPYAREEGAKNRVTYSKMSAKDEIINIMCGILPVTPLCIINIAFGAALLCPMIVMSVMVWYLRKKIGGYTGDCCGACYLLCELSMLSSISFLSYLKI